MVQILFLETRTFVFKFLILIILINSLHLAHGEYIYPFTE